MATRGTGVPNFFLPSLHGLAKLENGRRDTLSRLRAVSPLFRSTSSGESQIRRYILENDLLGSYYCPSGQFSNAGIGILYLDLQ